MDAADRPVNVTIHYNAMVVTEVTYESPGGEKTVHFPAHEGVVRLAMDIGPGALCYTTGNDVPWTRHRTEKWYGVGFDVTAGGIVDFGRPHRGPLRLSNHPQLFLDDYLVADMEGMKRRITRARKHPCNPITIEQEYPWEAARVRCGTVIYEPETAKFRMWYTAYAKNPGDNPGRCCYAESDDGITYRAVFAHQNFQPITPLSGIFTSTSADGIAWSKPAHVGLGKCDNPPSVVWYEPIGKYILATRPQATDPVFKGYWCVTGISESRDFVHWSSKKSFILTDDVDGYPFAQFHDIQQMVYGDVVIGAASVMHLTDKTGKNNKSATANVQLVTTRNGWRWHRVANRAVFLDNGPDDYDRIMALATSAMTVKDDTVYLYYHGAGKMNCQRREAHKAKHGKKGRRLLRGLCLATVPADRFVGLIPAARGKTGVLRAKVFNAVGRELTVNAKLADPNDLRVEVLDGTGNTLSGFEAARSRLTVRDRLRYRVVWDGSGAPKALADALPSGPVALRFHLRRGALYAFQIFK